jgi:cellulose synthase/poly-beta-1,6-N-acetylglucosamine synthase-like glycosyltransferase
MKTPLKYALGVALFGVLLAGSVCSQTLSAIRGRIIDPARGYRLTGLTVTAIGWTSGKQYQTASDDVGAFFFNEVEPDTYTISSECPGLERVISRADARPGLACSVELVGVALAQFDRSNLTKYILSTAGQGGRYPAGNISYLNVNDPVDTYFMLAYFGILIILSIYGVYRYRLIYLFLRYKNHHPQPKSRFDHGNLPRITIQLPLYNEMYVAERLIKAVSEIDYPREVLEIQVLDDSTDETRQIASRAVKRCFEQGFDITYRHRDNRIGFKAGALEQGLKSSTGDLVLIFDADFVPRPDCIRRMVDYFTDERVGLVQMRWSHINQDYSLLTKVQAIMLDGHFVIEQTARNRCGGFFNFNGTAGMWRRQAIEWSGGWQHDTLAEDTDLSYRAQLMGWRFVYLLDDDVPSELPVELNAFKSQQKRWAKGLVQVGLKMLKRILHDPRLPMRVKLEQALRLTGNLAAPLVILLALINFPVLIVRYNQGLFHLFLLDVPILTLSTISVVLFYVVPQWHLYPKSWKSSLKYIPFVLSMGIALTFSNARAVLEAVFGVKTPFVRTPKYGLQDSRDSSWLRKRYTRRRIQVPVLETSFAIYFLFTIWYAAYSRIIGTIPFLLIYFIGYAYAAVMSIVQSRVKPRAATGKRQ